MAKDVDLTSQAWTSVIFEGKNKDYGAYVLRRESPKRHLFAFIGVGIAAVILFSMPTLVSILGVGQNKDKNTSVTELSDIKLDKPEDKKEEQQKEYKAPPPPELKSTIQFTAPIIKKDEDVKEEKELKTQEELTESKVTISVSDVKGTNEETGVDAATLQTHKEIVQAEPEEKVFDVVEVSPSFPGGEAALMEYLSNNIKYPIIAQENSIQGKVVVQFVVGKDGSIQDVQVARKVDPSLDKEAVRVVSSMPKWIPGKQGGNAVRVKFFVPVNFKLQ